MPSVLEDKDAIREVLAAYCFHFDGGHFEDWLALFTPDGIFDVHGVGRFVGHEQLRAFVNSIPLADGVPTMKHCVMNDIVRIDGDTATARCYVLVVRPGTRLEVSVAGRYEDRLQRDGGQWRFAERHAFLDFMNR